MPQVAGKAHSGGKKVIGVSGMNLAIAHRILVDAAQFLAQYMRAMQK